MTSWACGVGSLAYRRWHFARVHTYPCLLVLHCTALDFARWGCFDVSHVFSADSSLPSAALMSRGCGTRCLTARSASNFAMIIRLFTAREVNCRSNLQVLANGANLELSTQSLGVVQFADGEALRNGLAPIATHVKIVLTAVLGQIHPGALCRSLNDSRELHWKVNMIQHVQTNRSQVTSMEGYRLCKKR
eukprot:69627-Amphidinium_carterae.2